MKPEAGVAMALNEREFFTERPETRPTLVTCPRCRHQAEYPVRWIRRTKKPQIPPRADERDRALYAKLRDYLVRVDDDVVCARCRRKIEIPSQSLMFL
jgi:DNA-directed RNA polymerase subunit RPC12/RpoP